VLGHAPSLLLTHAQIQDIGPGRRYSLRVERGKLGRAVREAAGSIRTVFRNRSLRRINTAFAASLLGDWAYATAVVVWAYGAGGVALVGVFSVLRLVLAAVTTPMASTLADRLDRRLVMVGSDLARMTLILAAAVALIVDAPAWTVFVLALTATIAATPFRPAQASLLPSLVDTPAELTATNGVTSTIESVGFFLGPALGALLITVTDVPAVFIANAATFVLSAVLVLGVRGPARARPEPRDEAAEAPEPFLAASAAGFHAVWADHDLRMVVGICMAQTIVAGASIVFSVEIAVDLLRSGPEAVGYLDSAFGVGAIIGGFLSVVLGSGQRLAVDFGWGVMFWGIPLLLVVAWPAALPAFAAMLVMGVANPIVDVNVTTLLQRLVPDRVLGRVFGALDAAVIATMAVGSLVMPALIAWVGLRAGLAMLAGLMVLVVVPAFPRLRRLDAKVGEPAGLRLLRQVPLFAPLEPAKLERLAGLLTRVEVPAGTVVVQEGETGDRFYVVESGLVQASHDGASLSSAGPPEPFGEIALIEDVPRTATVTALEPTVLWALDRDDFLAAVTGDDEVRSRVEDLVARRIRTV
jgi:MFS family permease